MTSHELAKQLLAGPDLPIGIHAVKEWDDDDEALKTPIIEQVTGENSETEEPCQVLTIVY